MSNTSSSSRWLCRNCGGYNDDRVDVCAQRVSSYTCGALRRLHGQDESTIYQAGRAQRHSQAGRVPPSDQPPQLITLAIVLPNNTTTRVKISPEASTAALVQQVASGRHRSLLKPPQGTCLRLFREQDGQDGLPEADPIEVPLSERIQVGALNLGASGRLLFELNATKSSAGDDDSESTAAPVVTDAGSSSSPGFFARLSSGVSGISTAVTSAVGWSEPEAELPPSTWAELAASPTFLSELGAIHDYAHLRAYLQRLTTSNPTKRKLIEANREDFTALLNEAHSVSGQDAMGGFVHEAVGGGVAISAKVAAAAAEEAAAPAAAVSTQPAGRKRTRGGSNSGGAAVDPPPVSGLTLLSDFTVEPSAGPDHMQLVGILSSFQIDTVGSLAATDMPVLAGLLVNTDASIDQARALHLRATAVMQAAAASSSSAGTSVGVSGSGTVEVDADDDPTLAAYGRLEPQKQAQRVGRQLFLGPLQVASNPAYLALLGVDSCVSLLADPTEFERVATDRKVLFQVEDSVDAEHNMSSNLAPAIERIASEIVAGWTVLVHCQSGISRSATAAIGYLMSEVGHDGRLLMEAYAHVRAQRPCVNPNDGFFRALQQHEMTTLGRVKTATQQRADEQEYHAHQITSQLAWANVTLAQARRALRAAGGDAAAAASELLASVDM